MTAGTAYMQDWQTDQIATANGIEAFCVPDKWSETTVWYAFFKSVGTDGPMAMGATRREAIDALLDEAEAADARARNALIYYGLIAVAIWCLCVAWLIWR